MVLNDVIQNINLLVGILTILILFFVLSFFKPLTKRYSRHNLRQFRFYLLSLSLLVFTTVGYWYLDIRVINLPDPVLPFVFYILVFTIYFGWKITAVTA